MLVVNDATTDSRVRKSALAVAATGARVTLVALSPDGVRRDSMLGPVRITRVPVDFVLRDAARARSLRRRTAGLPLLRPLGAERELELRRRLAARTRDGVAGNSRARAQVRHHGLRARRYAGRLGAKASRLVWGGLDRARSTVAVGARWRRILPEVDDYELSFGPVIDALRPDIIHAHDVQMMPVAARAAARARAAGRRVPWIYDAHEWVAGLSQYSGRTRRTIGAWVDLEQELIACADAVVTVSPDLADALRKRYHLRETPTVVMNIPPTVGVADTEGGVRAAAGLDPGTPLLVYSGGVQEARGVDTAVAALPSLPRVHLAIVAVPTVSAPAVQRLLVQAAKLGVAERVHALEPVAPHQVVDFLRTADVGLIPLRHYGSHEFALANKLFEYLHAGVPMVVSDCRAQAQLVGGAGIGLVHRAGDPDELAERVRSVLADLPAWRERVRSSPARSEYTWPTQVERLQMLYERLSNGAVSPAQPDAGAGVEPPETAWQRAPRATVHLGVGPTNSAGQAWAWTQAVRRAWPSVETEVVALINDKYDYPCDIAVPRGVYAHDATWALDLRERARETWTHALFEAGRAIFGTLGGGDPRADVAVLQEAGVEVGLVFHGSEVRDPARHAMTHEFSPFTNPRDPYTARLQDVADRSLALAREFGGRVFVSTPDQLDYLPEATWLPVVVDLDAWPLRQRSGSVPLVVHAPSNPVLKGTAIVQAAVGQFVESGRIRYREVTGLQPQEAAALIREADIVIDQVLLGLYGVLACEALASGAVVLGHVGEALRARVPVEIPVIEATPATLVDVLDRSIGDLEVLRTGGSQRRRFVRDFHDGRISATVLGDFLGQPAPTTTEVLAP